VVILADSSVWIAHFRTHNATLSDLLEDDRICAHPFVIGELACGQLPDRGAFLRFLRGMRSAPEATHPELLAFIQGRRLMGRGIGYGDVQLVAACKLGEDTVLWTLDQRLRAVAQELEVSFEP
jgi:predicted nucleic acid-binding protein